jgi:hypothetical protein
MRVLKPEVAIFTDGLYGPSFGTGLDLFISDESNKNQYSFSNLGASFQKDIFITEPLNFLSGYFVFQTNEIEVYHLKFDRKLF